MSLLFVFGKALKKMVKNRMADWAAQIGAVPPEQAGFQPGRSTTDFIASLAQPIFDGLSDPKPTQRSLLVALDFEVSFDKVWREGLLRDLSRLGAPSGQLLEERAAGAEVQGAVEPGPEPSSPLLGLEFRRAVRSVRSSLSSPLRPAIRSASPDCDVSVTL